MSEEETTEEKQKGVLNVIASLVSTIGIFVIALFIVLFVFQRVIVNGDSMNPTLSNGDNLMIDKICYKINHSLNRYDIIVFPHAGTHFVKRIIGLPGETVQIDEEGKIHIDDAVVLDESFGLEQINDPGIARTPVMLGPDEYFVLGDNRNNSDDSRDPNVGPVKAEQITGRVLVRIYPFNKMGVLLAPDE